MSREIKTVPLQVLVDAMRLAWMEDPRDGMILEILTETAIRNTECRLLDVADLWKNDTVPLSLILRPEISKNSRGRAIQLTHTFQKKIRNYILEHRSGPNGPMVEQPLFPSRSHRGYLTRKGLAGVVTKYLERAGQRNTPHAIRHTAATELLRVSNARVVQIILGHRRLDTVQIYTHPSDEDLRAAVESRQRGSPRAVDRSDQADQGASPPAPAPAAREPRARGRAPQKD